jgi:hypothetical protein
MSGMCKRMGGSIRRRELMQGSNRCKGNGRTLLARIGLRRLKPVCGTHARPTESEQCIEAAEARATEGGRESVRVRTVSGHFEQRRDLAARLLPVRVAVQRQRCKPYDALLSETRSGVRRRARHDIGAGAAWWRQAAAFKHDSTDISERSSSASSPQNRQRQQQTQAKAVRGTENRATHRRTGRRRNRRRWARRKTRISLRSERQTG